MNHNNHDRIFDWPTTHLLSNNLLHSAGGLPNILKGMPTDTCSLARSIKHTMLRVEYKWFSYDSDKGSITRHWDCIESIRNMVRLAGDKRPGSQLTIKLSLYDVKHRNDAELDEFKTDCLPLFEQVPDHVDLTLGFHFKRLHWVFAGREEEGKVVELLKIDKDYLAMLQGTNRSAHFKGRDDSLMLAFYRLRGFADWVLGGIENRDEIWWLTQSKQEAGCNLIGKWLTMAWEARNKGDRAQFAVAKNGLVDLWMKQKKAYMAKLAET